MQKLSLNHAVIGTVAAIAVMSLITVSDANARGKRGGSAEDAFTRLDTDLSGTLTLEELTVPAATKAENKFTRKDTDADGFLTFEEATAGREPVDHSDIAEDIASCVAEVKEETGNDAIVVPDPANYQSPQERFDAKDTSGDGLVDLAEMQAAAEAKATQGFTNMDTDASDDVSLEEFTAAKESRKATRRAIKSCVEELTAEEGF